MPKGRQFTKGIDLYRAQMAKFKRDNLSLRQAWEDNVEASRNDHEELVGGHVSTKQLVAMGHPFGRGPVPQRKGARNISLALRGNRAIGMTIRRRLPALPINKQTGKLARSLKMVKVGKNVFEVYFNPGDGRVWVLWPGGTGTMIDRGFYKEIERRIKARNKALDDQYRDIMNRP